VARYDDPEAWLRKVALGLLSNERRRIRNAVRMLRRIGRPATEDGPSGERVDVRRALETLPQAQRAVLVLHHYVGLGVDEVARELGIPAGTVKSRLSRGRAALAPLLIEDVNHDARR
jgi:RNA polymerase sigma-70 factor (ECF subfamily)